jgi:predicted dehydrogenase
MQQIENNPGSNEFNRREFIQNTASFGALMALMGGVPLYAEETNSAAAPTNYSTVSAPVNCAVIGCGAWGREILQTLSRLPNAPVVAICDNYEAAFRRVKESAPNAETFADYHKLLEKKEVQAVIVATPSYQHRAIVEAALAAGKHVYCEAPLATTVEDARAIAKAAKAAGKVYFQSGLQMRSDPQRQFLVPFIRSGATGVNVMARTQWHKKQSWRRTAPTPEREQALNWNLNAATSPGLMGELVIHQLDMVNWLLNIRPVAVSGWGSTLLWKDGRDVADTIQAVFEFPDGSNYFADASLANSFDSAYEILYGSFSAVMLRHDEDGSRAWLFKEVDSPLLGWEVYPPKVQFYKETGITLMAGASKTPPKQKEGEALPPTVTPLQHALAAFITNSGLIAKGVESFLKISDDMDELRESLGTIKQTKSWKGAAGWQEGLDATILALKANEAIVKGGGNRIAIQKEWFDI